MAQLELVDRQKDLFLLLRKPSAPAGRSLAIFIHGFLGDHVTTWGRLPEILRENALSEPLLASCDFLFLGYSTRQIASYLDIARLRRLLILRKSLFGRVTRRSTREQKWNLAVGEDRK